MNVYITELSKALANEGAHVEIFTRRTNSSDPAVVEMSEGVLVRHIEAGPYEGLDKNDLPGQLCKFTQGVLRTEATHAPNWYNVVHSHYWLSGQAGWLAADRWNVPLVHSMHTMARVKNAQLAPGDTPEPRGRIIGEEQVVAEADALIANTKHEARELAEYYDAPAEKLHVVPPGVDLSTFSDANPRGLSRAQERALHGIAPHQRVIVFAGRVQPLKGPDVLVEMLSYLQTLVLSNNSSGSGVGGLGASRASASGDTGHVESRHSMDPTSLRKLSAHQRDTLVARSDSLTLAMIPTLVILGGASGKKTALLELKAQVHALGLDRYVRFEPPAKRADLAAWFRIADLVAMPSRNESFGLVAVEAQACGTPVIAAEVGGLRTAVSHDVSGILVPSHDPRLWALEVHSLLADGTVDRGTGGHSGGSRLARLSANARTVASGFTWQHTAQAMLNVYDTASRSKVTVK